MKKKEEIVIENEDHIATFVLNNGTDYDICQLFEKDKQYDKVAYIKGWVSQDCFSTHIKNKDKIIADLKQENKKLYAYIRHLILTIRNQKEKLENAIATPKYKIGQEMWRSWSSVRAIREPIDTIHIFKDGRIGYEFADSFDVFMEEELFWTEDEAKKAWEEKHNGRT